MEKGVIYIIYMNKFKEKNKAIKFKNSLTIMKFSKPTQLIVVLARVSILLIVIKDNQNYYAQMIIVSRHLKIRF
jgi:hypothetical protein